MAIDNSAIEGPLLKSGLVLYIVYFLVTGGWVGSEYAAGHEQAKTWLAVFIHLGLCVIGAILAFILMGQLPRNRQRNLGFALRIVWIISFLSLGIYIGLRVF